MAVWICIGHGTSYDHHHHARRPSALSLLRRQRPAVCSRSVSTIHQPPLPRVFYLTLGLKLATLIAREKKRGRKGKRGSEISRRQGSRQADSNGKRRRIGRGSQLDRIKSRWLIVVAVLAVAIAINSFARLSAYYAPVSTNLLSVQIFNSQLFLPIIF